LSGTWLSVYRVRCPVCYCQCSGGPCSIHLCNSHLIPWIWRQQIPSKRRRLPITFYGVTIHNHKFNLYSREDAKIQILILRQIFLKNGAKLFLMTWPDFQGEATDSSADIIFLNWAENNLFHVMLQRLYHLAGGDTLWAGEHDIILRHISWVLTFPKHISFCVALYTPFSLVFTC
jgi:hypothetical protein